MRSVQDLERVFTALAPFYEYDPERSPPGGFKPIADIDALNWFFAHDRHTYDVRPRLAGITVPTLALSPAAIQDRAARCVRGIVNGIPGPYRWCSRKAAAAPDAGRERQVPPTVRDFIRRLPRSYGLRIVDELRVPPAREP